MAGLRIRITAKDGSTQEVDIDKAEALIGRGKNSEVFLNAGNITKRHARIIVKDSKLIVVDLKSTNGTYVNGRRLNSPLVIKPSDLIIVGDFTLSAEALPDPEQLTQRHTAPPRPEHPDSVWLSEIEAADFLGLSLADLESLKGSNEAPPCYRMGPSSSAVIRYRRSELVQWRRVNPAPTP